MSCAPRGASAHHDLADDDVLIFAPNLRARSRRHPDLSGATPYYLGNAWCRSRKAQIEDGGPNICGGGGYVLSRGALAKLDFDGGGKDAKPDALVRACAEYSTVDDAALNLVMAKAGVLPTHCNAFHYSFARDATAPHRLANLDRPGAPRMRPVSFHLRGQSTTRQRVPTRSSARRPSPSCGCAEPTRPRASGAITGGASSPERLDYLVLGQPSTASIRDTNLPTRRRWWREIRDAAERAHTPTPPRCTAPLHAFAPLHTNCFSRWPHKIARR